MMQALEDIKNAGCNALCVYLGNFGPEIAETMLAKNFNGPKMFIAAAEETSANGGLVQGRGDAYCGMLNASYNLKLRGVKAYIPEYPVGTAEECADMIHEFIPVAKAVYALSNLKIISFGPRPNNFLACNAPIAGLLFVIEEVYHHFSRFFWVSTLAASLVANFISLLIFGLTPVLDMPDNIPLMTLDQYWIYLLMGVFLGLSGFLYEKAVLNVGRVYDWLGQKIHLDRAYYPILAFILIIPVGIFLPQILGGGNQVVLSLTEQDFSFQVLLAYFLIRFVWSMISYGSGLPGGIFLPILALGSLLGALVGVICVNFGLVSQEQFPIFVILGMSGYFGAISKAPLTAMILVTEMVGDIRNLMPLGLVTLVAYIIMDLLKGAPVYEAMLETDEGEVTLIEIPVSDKIAGKQVHELNLPHNVLITTQVHNGNSQTVHGSTRMYLGDMIHLVIPKSEIGKVKDLLL